MTKPLHQPYLLLPLVFITWWTLTLKTTHPNSTLNQNTDNLDKEIYSVEQTKGNVDLTVDHRLLSEEGRKDIAEDTERTVRLAESIKDVVSKDAFEVGDTLDHIDEVQKDLDVQKAFAQVGDGKLIEIVLSHRPTP